MMSAAATPTLQTNGNGGEPRPVPAQSGEESLSPLEQEVLDEYARLVGNLDGVSLLFMLSISP